MGYNLENRMPLWVKPRTKVSPKTVFDCMRDHYEGTPMDMTRDLRAGGHNCPYRWRPMTFEVDDVEYLNERATATQQIGFWFVAQARPEVAPDMGILWFGVDERRHVVSDADLLLRKRGARVVSARDNGSMLEYSPTSAFWLFNRVTNFAYMRYDMISADIRKVVDAWENGLLEQVAEVDAKPGARLEAGPQPHPHHLQRGDGTEAVRRWSKLTSTCSSIHGRQREERARRCARLPRRQCRGGTLRGKRQRTPDSGQDLVPGLQREVEARCGGRQRRDVESN